MDAARSSSRGHFVSVNGDHTGSHAGAVPAQISKAIIDQAHEHQLRAIAHIFYLYTAKTFVWQPVDGFAHSAPPGTNMTSPGIASDADLASVIA